MVKSLCLSLAISTTKDLQFALAPPYLSSLHSRLDDYMATLINEVGHNVVVPHADSIFTSVHLEKRFPFLTLNPIEFPMVVQVLVELEVGSKRLAGRLGRGNNFKSTSPQVTY